MQAKDVFSEFDLEDRKTHKQFFTVCRYPNRIEPVEGCDTAFVALHRNEIEAAIAVQPSPFFLR